jgi:hypothetical protein
MNTILPSRFGNQFQAPPTDLSNSFTATTTGVSAGNKIRHPFRTEEAMTAKRREKRDQCVGTEHYSPKNPCRKRRCGCVVHSLQMWGSKERYDSLEPCDGFVPLCKDRGPIFRAARRQRGHKK